VKRLIALQCAAVIVAASSDAVKTEPKRVVAYFPESGIEHQPYYYVKDVEMQGAAPGEYEPGINNYSYLQPLLKEATNIAPKVFQLM
jgi:hypothetical protein